MACGYAQVTGLADRAFVERLGEVLQDLEDLAMAPTLTADQQITTERRRLRALSMDERQAAYRDGRVEEQRSWYAAKAVSNGRMGDRSSLLVVAFECGGVLGAVFKAFEVIDFDALGLLAAAAAALTAWSQAKQYQILNRAYFVASQELATIKSQSRQSMAEPEWSQFVQEAEEAISREHALWRASRGVRANRY